MAGYNGSGTFVRTHNWVSDKNAALKIDSARMDAEDDGFATGLSTAITKDGQTTITANIPFNSNKITEIASGTARTDGSNVGDIQDNTYLWAGTGAGTVDVITANLSPAITAYVTGQQFALLSSGANTGAVTVNFNAVGAKSITKNGTTALAAGDIPASSIIFIVYDGTQFQLVGQILVTATETKEGIVELATQAEVNTGTDTARSITPATLKSHLTTPNPIGATTASTGKFSSLQLPAGATITEFSTDGTMAGNSAVHVPTESAVKTYVDGLATAATQAQQETATSTAVVVTPGRQQYHPSAAKAWVNFNGTGAVPIRDSYNVSSITDNTTGDYTVNFSTSFSGANYSVAGVAGDVGLGRGTAISPHNSTTLLAGSCRILTSQATTAQDMNTICASFYGDQ